MVPEQHSIVCKTGRAMNRRAPVAQLDIFGAVAQPRIQTTETHALFDDVVLLRRAGMTVYRTGRGLHSINGQSRTARQLHELAADVRADLAMREAIAEACSRAIAATEAGHMTAALEAVDTARAALTQNMTGGVNGH